MPNDFTGLLTGSTWAGIEAADSPTIVTYSFPTTGAPPAYIASLNDPALTPAAIASYQGFDAAEQALARTALAEWGDNSGLIFIEVAPGQGDINFQKLDFSGTGYDGAGGIAYRPFGAWDGFSYPDFTDDLDSSGDVFMNSDIAVNYGTLLHEIGHALGLKHPTEAWTQFAAFPPVVHTVWDVDDPALTIMSQLSGGSGHLTAIDLQAVQFIYGTQAEDGTQVATWSFNAGTQTLTQNGGGLADRVRGSSVLDVIRGNGGDDALFGLAGNDSLFGGSGNDSLFGGSGTNRLVGGLGDDIYFARSGDVLAEVAGQGFDWVYAASDIRLANNIEGLILFGTTPFKATGNTLANTLITGDGADTLLGLAGDDVLQGNAGNDRLTGGAGRDDLYGGIGADRFLFTSLADFAPLANPDKIWDFSQTDRDKIDLHLIDSDAVTPGDQGFTFIGTAAFSNAPGQVQLRFETQVNGTPFTVVQIDINNDQTADYAIDFDTNPTLRATDFLL